MTRSGWASTSNSPLHLAFKAKDKAAVDAFYEENKARIPQPKEQVAPQIRQYLQQRGQFEAREKFFTDLESKYKVEMKMEPMRTEVAAVGPGATRFAVEHGLA